MVFLFLLNYIKCLFTICERKTFKFNKKRLPCFIFCCCCCRFRKIFMLKLVFDDLGWSSHSSVSIDFFVFETGNLMVPKLIDGGLEAALVLPTGCGEQTMFKLAPNVYVLQYLYNTNQVTEDVKAMTNEHIKSGSHLPKRDSLTNLKHCCSRLATINVY